MTRHLTAQDISILYLLKAELTSLKQSLRLAETIATYPDNRESAHPVVNFAFARTGPAAIENLLLRMAEAVDHYLERAYQRQLARSLLTGKGRKRRPVSENLDLLLRLRSEIVAHRVKLRGFSGTAWTELHTRFQSIWRFLEAVLNEVEGLLDELDLSGLFRPLAGQVIKVRHYQEFTQADVKAVVECANALIREKSTGTTA